VAHETFNMYVRSNAAAAACCARHGNSADEYTNMPRASSYRATRKRTTKEEGSLTVTDPNQTSY